MEGAEGRTGGRLTGADDSRLGVQTGLHAVPGEASRPPPSRRFGLQLKLS